MNPLNSKKRFDESTGIVEIETNKVMNAKKTPWFLRFAESFDPKSIVQIAGIGTLYGVLFAGLLLMPLPRPLEMQARFDIESPCWNITV